MSMYAQIQKNVSDYYLLLKKQYATKYVKEALLGIVILSGLFGGYFLHNFYVKYREKRAFGALVEVVESYEKAQYRTMAAGSDKTKVEEEWKDVEVLLDALYKDNIGSYLAPYFLMFKAQIELEKGGDVDKAREIIADALSKVSNGSELFSLFNMKRIKLAFDSKDEKVREAALNDLKVIAGNTNDYSYEEALYLLGAYYLYQADIVQAHKTWKELASIGEKKDLIKSPWVAQAQEKLGSLA